MKVTALTGPLCQGQEPQGQEAMEVGNQVEELNISKPQFLRRLVVAEAIASPLPENRLSLLNASRGAAR